MNDKFFELSVEKQQAIINAALEVFAKNEYKHAVTDDIAAKAGISKGLLFYYFHNKKSLYTYLFEYTRDFLEQEIINEEYVQFEDFFELLMYVAGMKYRIFIKNPFLLEFSEKVIMKSDEEAGSEIRKQLSDYSNKRLMKFFEHIDYTRFKEGTDPMKLMKMLIWMAQGFLFEQTQAGKKCNLDEIMKEFQDWVTCFKKIAYKEEWQ